MAKKKPITAEELQDKIDELKPGEPSESVSESTPQTGAGSQEASVLDILLMTKERMLKLKAKATADHKRTIASAAGSIAHEIDELIKRAGVAKYDIEA